MAVDVPAKVAVLGAGPIGLEAALYARYLGYAVDVYERGQVAENVLAWGHVQMFSPFGMNRSPLGLAALAAQDTEYQPPRDDELLTGGQWVERYLLPLSRSDLLADAIQTETQVLGASRCDFFKTDLPGDARRAESPFQLLLSRAGRLCNETADVVIDTTGVLATPCSLGAGGLPAIGEQAAHDAIVRIPPDVLGDQREHYAGRHTLVVGSGYSAATTVVALKQLAEQAPGTRVTWLTRRAPAGAGPIRLIEGDRLAERDRLARAANSCAVGGDANIAYWPATTIDAITKDDSGIEVATSGEHAGTFSFERMIANVGYRPDTSIFRELQVHECYASQGPMKLAAALSGQSSADCLDQSSCGPQSLLNPEPNFYILGAKSYGRNSSFLVSVGLDQIRELFTIIGDRENLDLYDSVKNLLV